MDHQETKDSKMHQFVHENLKANNDFIEMMASFANKEDAPGLFGMEKKDPKVEVIYYEGTQHLNNNLAKQKLMERKFKALAAEEFILENMSVIKIECGNQDLQQELNSLKMQP